MALLLAIKNNFFVFSLETKPQNAKVLDNTGQIELTATLIICVLAHLTDRPSRDTE